MVDKPAGLTSHDVVARIRRIAGTRRVGHTGTLDPMATGVLVVCLGKATRLVPYIEEMGGWDAKEYEAGIRFGFETTTDDAEGEPRGGSGPGAVPDAAAVTAALAGLVGEFEQVPPAFSAKKVAGERAYAMARRGEDFELKPVRVSVGRAELLGLEEGIARVRIACSRGTYIRSLARDLGRALASGAHLVSLRRTRSGSADLRQAVRLDDLTPQSLGAALIPMAAVLEGWPSVVVGAPEAADLRLGRSIDSGAAASTASGRVRVCDREGHLVALARPEAGRLVPFCVF